LRKYISLVGDIMKTLYIIRHAKSSWRDISTDDFDRPLRQRGKNDALLMANKLLEFGISPDFIISSPSKRTKCTVDIITTQIKYNKEIEYNNKIYESNMLSLKNIIKNIDNQYNVVFLFGHNPGLNMLAEDLCGFVKNIATTGIIGIRFNINSWSDISNRNSVFLEYIYPKKYK